MAKGKDFYGKDVTEAIRQACRSFAVPQEELAIEVLETGSAGIFGLCRKKAHIRVTLKSKAEEKPAGQPDKASPAKQQKKEKTARKKESGPEKKKAARKEATVAPAEGQTGKEDRAVAEKEVSEKQAPEAEAAQPAPAVPARKEKKDRPKRGRPAAVDREQPSAEVLDSIRTDLAQLLTLMGFPSEVTVDIEEYSVRCRISGAHEEAIIGSDGRTLDSLQYLLRKMMSRRLPDRMMLTLDAGNFRERRAEELKERARDLAGQVREDGKTRAIPALNPSERRVVHMTLQEDKSIRSRSVGEGLFKKVLIYRPGKDKKSGSRKRRGRQGDRSSNN